MKRNWVPTFFALSVLVLSGCSPKTIIVPMEVTRIVRQEVTAVPVQPEPPAQPAAPVIPEQPPEIIPEPQSPPEPFTVSIPDRQVYFPVPNCSHSRTRVGDTIVVTVDDPPRLSVRSYSDNHPADNIVGKIYKGEFAVITGAPECSWGWIMWPIKAQGKDLEGWIAESKGKEFWFAPVDSPDVARNMLSDNEYQAYQAASGVMNNPNLSQDQKREQIKVLQRNWGEETVTTVMRYVPVCNDNMNCVSFDHYMRDFAQETSGSITNKSAPIEKDPIGASMKIFNNPTVDTINEMLGLGN